MIDGQLKDDLRVAGPFGPTAHPEAAFASSQRKVEVDVVLDGFPTPVARRLRVFTDAAAVREHVIAGHAGDHWDARFAWSEPQSEFTKQSLSVEAEDAMAVLGGDLKIHEPRLTAVCAMDNEELRTFRRERPSTKAFLGMES